MQREFARIIRDDAASVEDDALNLCAFPMLPPPRDVVSLRVNLRDVRLPPAQRAAIPRQRAAHIGFGGNRNIIRHTCSQCSKINTRNPMAAVALFLRKARRVSPVDVMRPV